MRSCGSRGYIPDLLYALTGASWGLPKESLGSAQGCVGLLVRGPGALPMNYRVPLYYGVNGVYPDAWFVGEAMVFQSPEMQSTAGDNQA